MMRFFWFLDALCGGVEDGQTWHIGGIPRGDSPSSDDERDNSPPAMASISSPKKNLYGRDDRFAQSSSP